MGAEAATPPGFWDRVRQIAADEVAKLLRSGLLRNASISEGGLTIKGGFLRLLSAVTGGFDTFYLGPVDPPRADGSPQQGWVVRRADGTIVLQLYDAFPTDSGGALNQALDWRDRGGNIVLADDTDSGQGIARPYVSGAFYRARNVDWPTTTSPTFETIYRAKMPKQHPKLYVRAWGINTVAGATGEIRVMVNGAQLGTTQGTISGTVTESVFGPAAVAGAHMADLSVEIQARLASGTGAVQVGVSRGAEGSQT
jgi:hypothetical protein